MLNRRLELEIKDFSLLSSLEKKKISKFIQENSDMDEDYSESEFFRYSDRQILMIKTNNDELRCVLSAKYIYDKESFIYWGDLIKEKTFRGIDLSYLFFKFLIKKEGILGIILNNKHFLSFCYNPRALDLLPRYLENFSRLEENSSHKNFSNCIERLGYSSNVQNGFFVDSSIHSKIRLNVEKRYRSKDQRVNDFFAKNVLERDEHHNLMYSGKSLAIVTSYSKSRLFAMAWNLILNLAIKPLQDYFPNLLVTPNEIALKILPIFGQTAQKRSTLTASGREVLPPGKG